MREKQREPKSRRCEKKRAPSHCELAPSVGDMSEEDDDETGDGGDCSDGDCDDGEDEGDETIPMVRLLMSESETCDKKKQRERQDKK